MKCSIDQNRPAEFDFLQTRPKKEVLQEFRNVEIMRENRVLLNKISDISVEGLLGSDRRPQQVTDYRTLVIAAYLKDYQEARVWPNSDNIPLEYGDLESMSIERFNSLLDLWLDRVKPEEDYVTLLGILKGYRQSNSRNIKPDDDEKYIYLKELPYIIGYWRDQNNQVSIESSRRKEHKAMQTSTHNRTSSLQSTMQKEG
ncbi:unnamed protein product [Sphagnum balticum]